MSPVSTVLLSLLFVVFIIGGLFSGCLFVNTVAGFFSIDLPSPGFPIPFVSGSGSGDEGPAWQGRERLTILLLGLDQREDERGQPTRSDTMILLTVDPVSKSAGMLSFPRDLWVPIPGHGENKINTAHFFGEVEKAGNGPALAKKTIEYNFGVRVNYYARVDFRGFEKLVDALGGITIDVPRPIRDDEYPTPDYGITRVYIPAGLQRMDGQTALRYARSRHADSDFGRNSRQMAVLLAARNEALQASVLPKLPQMVGILRDAMTTDVPVTDILPMLSLMRSIDSSNIVSKSIEYNMVDDINGDGTILVPIRDRIAPVIQELFTSPTPTPVPSPTSRPSPTPQPTSAAQLRIEVLNGTSRDGFAASTAEALKSRGYRITNVAQATRADYAMSEILDHTGRSKDIPALVQFLGVPATAVRQEAGNGTSDVTIILGLDARPEITP